MASIIPGLHKVIQVIQPIVILTVICIFSGCSINKKEVRAYIDTNSKWKMEENCGYEDCYPMVDFLKGKDIAIRFEVDKDYYNRYFVIVSSILPPRDSLMLNADKIYIDVNNKHFKAKVLKCYVPNRQPGYLWTEPSLSGSVDTTERGCFLLFIDHPTPLPTDDVILNINEALTLNDKLLDVPRIYFRRNMDLKEK